MSKRDNHERAADLLAHLVSFDTTSHRANRGCIDFMRDYLDGLGIASDLVPGKEDGKACLWVTLGGAGLREGGIVLAGHTDTVPVDGQDWTSDPFTLTDRDDKWVARGSADMKGFIACALALAPQLAKGSQRVHFALTCDEETDMSGAMRLTDWLAQRQIVPAWFWIGEPTRLTIVDQHKGVAAYRTRLTGVSGHSSLPDAGLNAIELGGDFMSVIRAQAQNRKDRPYRPSRFDPPYSTYNLGVIKGGSAENIIADQCEILWQIRAHPGDSAVRLAQEVEVEAAGLLQARLAAFAPRASVETCACFDIPPFLATADNPGEKRLKQALRCDDTQAVGFATEAGIFQKTGAPAVICGPGSIAQAHQADEYIDKSQLAACVDLMQRVLL